MRSYNRAETRVSNAEGEMSHPKSTRTLDVADGFHSTIAEIGHGSGSAPVGRPEALLQFHMYCTWRESGALSENLVQEHDTQRVCLKTVRIHLVVYGRVANETHRVGTHGLVDARERAHADALAQQHRGHKPKERVRAAEQSQRLLLVGGVTLEVRAWMRMAQRQVSKTQRSSRIRLARSTQSPTCASTPSAAVSSCTAIEEKRFTCGRNFKCRRRADSAAIRFSIWQPSKALGSE